LRNIIKSDKIKKDTHEVMSKSADVVSLAAKEAREMGVQKRGQKWEVTIDIGERYENGRKKYYREGGFGSEKNAKQRENEILEELQSEMRKMKRQIQNLPIKEIEETSFEDFALRWLEKKRYEIRFSSWKRYREIIELHLIPFFRGKYVENITKADVEDYYRVNRNKIRQSIGKHRTVINQIFALAEDEKIISENNMQLAKSYGMKEPRPVRIIDDPYTLEKFVNSFRGTCLFIPVLLGAAEGMRESEIIALKWSDIDLKNGLIDINKSLHHDKQNGGHYEEDPKTAKSARILELSTNTIKILKAEKERRNPQKNDFVCLNSIGNAFNTKTLSSNFRRAVRTKKRGNLKISFKSLRTSFANIMRDLGVEDVAIQEAMGHASINTTRQHYFKTTRKQREQRRIAKESILVNV